MLLNPGRVEQELLIARGTVCLSVADTYSRVNAAIPYVNTILSLRDRIAIHIKNFTGNAQPIASRAVSIVLHVLRAY